MSTQTQADRERAADPPHRGYALDTVSPVRHVATELVAADGQPRTVRDLARTYSHIVTGDLARVRRHEGCADNAAATTWLIEYALAALSPWLEETDGGYRLTAPADALRFHGQPVVLYVDEHALLHDAFDPMGGGRVPGHPRRWSDNVRRGLGDLAELRESLREFGWVEQFPAIVDERGVVLVGHRRLAVAAELRAEGVMVNGKPVDDVVQTLTLGRGDAADAQRFRLAIVSNLAGKPFTKEERKDLAEYLYGEREWTEERIAKALNVTQKTVSKDLQDFIPQVLNEGRGRPKGSTKQRRPDADQRERDVIALATEVDDEGRRRYSQPEIARKLGTGITTVQGILRAARGRGLTLPLPPVRRPEPEPVAAAPATPTPPVPVPDPAPPVAQVLTDDEPAAPARGVYVCTCNNCGDQHPALTP